MRRWEQDLRPEFDKRGVIVVTVSTDTPKEIRKKRKHHGLQARMLSDRDLAVTDAFGLRNMGFHTGNPRDDIEALPVPTSLLIGADGKVLWKDQSEDYQRRSSPEIVLAALRKHLD